MRLRIPRIPGLCLDFSKVDRCLEKMTEIRDSYRSANLSIYGSAVAEMLNDWE